MTVALFVFDSHLADVEPPIKVVQMTNHDSAEIEL
jgi:hypothetical protein